MTAVTLHTRKGSHILHTTIGETVAVDGVYDDYLVTEGGDRILTEAGAYIVLDLASTLTTIKLTTRKPNTVLHTRVSMGQSHFVDESPIQQGAGESITYSLVFTDATTVTSVTSVKAYKGSTDVSTTVFPAGSTSVDGNTLTWKPLTALTGGEKYTISTIAVVDGNTLERFVEVLGLKSSTGYTRTK